jgi:parvulin-like peptidyl-prolyl isomerase
MGDEVEGVLRTLKPGQYSDAIKTEWGYSIVKFDKITDEDMMSLVKDQMRDLVQSEVRRDFETMTAAAKIEINDGAAPTASPATTPAPQASKR